jgi:hypothetical protein
LSNKVSRFTKRARFGQEAPKLDFQMTFFPLLESRNMVLDAKSSASLRKLRKEARKYSAHVYSVSSFLDSLVQTSSQKLSSSKKRRLRRKKLKQSYCHQPGSGIASSPRNSNTPQGAHRNQKFENLRRNLIISSSSPYPKTEKAVDRCQYLTQPEVQSSILF